MSKRPYHHGNLRPALIEAALQLAAERGPLGVTLREAARRAGVSHAAPYRHFPDKEGLLAAAATVGFEQLAVALDEETAGKEPGSALMATGRAYVRFALQHPGRFTVMFGPSVGDRSQHEALVAAEERTYSLLCERVDGAMRAGVIAVGDVDRVALTLWSTMHGLAALVSSGGFARRGLDAESVEGLAVDVGRQLFAGLHGKEQQGPDGGAR